MIKRNKIIKMASIGILVLSLFPTIASAANVTHRTVAENDFHKKTFEELGMYPQSTAKLMPLTKKVNIVVKKKGSTEKKDITNKLTLPIRMSEESTLMAITDFANIYGTPVSWYSGPKIVAIGDVDKFLKGYGKGGQYTKIVYVPINKDCIQVDAGIVATTVPALIDPTTNRSYLPIRVLGDLLNVGVNWDNSTNSVILELEEEQFMKLKHRYSF